MNSIMPKGPIHATNKGTWFKLSSGDSVTPVVINADEFAVMPDQYGYLKDNEATGVLIIPPKQPTSEIGHTIMTTLHNLIAHGRANEVPASTILDELERLVVWVEENDKA